MTGRFDRVIERIDEIHRDDPETEVVDGRPVPAELVYARRMTAWLTRLEPAASEPLRLAVRAQHLRRWAVPRASYPAGRAGYKRWRSELARMHADVAAAICAEEGYDPATIEQIRNLLMKRRLKSDPEAQTVEDVACLVFLEHHFADFAQKHDDDKLVDILRKTWTKMSERARGEALDLTLGENERRLLERALSGDR